MVPGSRKGVVQNALSTGTLGRMWYVTTRRSSVMLAISWAAVKPASGSRSESNELVKPYTWQAVTVGI